MFMPVPDLSNKLLSSCEHQSALLLGCFSPREKYLLGTGKDWFLPGMTWFCCAPSLLRAQWHVLGSVMEDFTRVRKQQGMSFGGGQEVGIAAKAKPELLDLSKAHKSAFLKAK